LNDSPGEIVSIAFRDNRDYAALTFADGAKEVRKCMLWEASEWAGAAGLAIVMAAGDFYRWGDPAKPEPDSLD